MIVSCDIRQLKRKLKRGPRMSRQMRTEFLLTEVGGSPRRLSPRVLAQLKTEITRIGNNGTRQGFEFAEKMFARYPELLRGA